MGGRFPIATHATGRARRYDERGQPMPELNLLFDAIVRGDAKFAAVLVLEALAENCEPLRLISNYMIPAMDEVGRRF